MSELLNWYIEELRQLLQAKIPADRLDTILREAESHLRESANCRISREVPDRLAMIEAINAYGTPKRIAISFLRRSGQKLFGMRPVYSAVGGCLIAIYAWNFHWLTLSGFFDNFGDSYENVIAGMFGLGGLALMFMACRSGMRSYRLAVSSACIIAAGLSIPIVSAWMIGGTRDYQGISRFHLQRDVPAVRKLVSDIVKDQAFLKRGMEAYSKADHQVEFLHQGAKIYIPGNLPFDDMELVSKLREQTLPPDLRNANLAVAELGVDHLNPAVHEMTVNPGGNFVVPREYGAFAMVREGLLAFETMDKYPAASKAWAKSGPIILRDLQREQVDMVALLSKADEAQHGRLFFFNPALYAETVFATLFLLPLFLLVDLVAALSASPRRSWPKRKVA
jgi:hypothetical protein